MTDTADLAQLLGAQQDEITRVILTRIDAVSPPSEFADGDYLRGLQAAVGEAVMYAVSVLERGTANMPPIPPALLVQARVAARHDVSLDAVLRRYIAGQVVLTDFVIERAEREKAIPRRAATKATRLISALLERIVDEVSEEYVKEARAAVPTSAKLQAERVKRLLAGEPLYGEHFGYDFDAVHIGAVASGEETLKAIRALGKQLGLHLLAAQPAEPVVWAWWTVTRGFDWAKLEDFVTSNWPATNTLAVGEPRSGLAGWRRTHREAQAATELAVRQPGALVRYGQNELLVAVLGDELLRDGLRDAYLKPLSGKRSGRDIPETLRAYFRTGRNGSSTAAVLDVSRQTVNTRIRRAEEFIGQPLTDCGTSLDVALWLDEVEREV